MDFSRFGPLFNRIEAELAARERTVLAIDGAAASGKTTLAAFLAEKYGAETVHMDDFFLPRERKTPERLAEPDGNIDRERFAAEVLSSLARHTFVTYRPYDCATATLSSSVSRPLAPLTVIEGVYSMHPDLHPSFPMLFVK
jgi:uridine kinase